MTRKKGVALDSAPCPRCAPSRTTPSTSDCVSAADGVLTIHLKCALGHAWTWELPMRLTITGVLPPDSADSPLRRRGGG